MKKLYLIIVCFSSLSYAQQIPLDSLQQDYIIFEGDTILRTSIELDEVFIFQRLKFNSKKERLRYYILRRKVLKVYPYAKLASERLTILNERLENIPTKREKKKYTKMVQKYIEEEFTEKLKKMTKTEGQILVKLIHRQTGNTAFSLIKNLRSGWKAFWYQTTAKTFKISLKKEYHPKNIHEDYLIEDILQRAFAVNKLEKQKSVLKFDYISLSNKWKNNSNKK